MSVSDEDFVAAWQKGGGSPSKVALLLGCNERAVYGRRERLEAARDEAIARGIRVNALVVNTYGAPAADWARQALVTPSGFVMEADGWQEVAAALRRKVTQEVSQR